MAKEICQDCGRLFEGGQNAFFCLACRKRRIGEAAKKRRAKEKLDKLIHANFKEPDINVCIEYENGNT